MSAVCPSCGQGWKHDASVCGHPFHCGDWGGHPEVSTALVETALGTEVLEFEALVHDAVVGWEFLACTNDVCMMHRALAQRLADAGHAFEMERDFALGQQELRVEALARATRAEGTLRECVRLTEDWNHPNADELVAVVDSALTPTEEPEHG